MREPFDEELDALTERWKFELDALLERYPTTTMLKLTELYSKLLAIYHDAFLALARHKATRPSTEPHDR